MKARAIKALLILLAVTLVGDGIAYFYSQTPREDDPVWNGKPLSVWLKGYEMASPGWSQQDRTEANTAMFHYGTNAVPMLLRMLAAKDSTLKIKFVGLARKQRLIHVRVEMATSKNMAAAAAFGELGPWIRSQVPVKSWIEIYDQRPCIISAGFIASALGDLGPDAKDAVPSLLKVAADVQQDFISRACAFTALGRIHSEPELVLPVLIRATKETNSELRRVAIQNVGIFGKDARPAVGTLVDLLNDTDFNVRQAASNSLAQIGPETAKKAGVILQTQ